MLNKQLSSVLKLGILAILFTVLVFKAVDSVRAEYHATELIEAPLYFESDHSEQVLDEGILPQSPRGYSLAPGSYRIPLPKDLLKSYEVLVINRSDIERVALVLKTHDQVVERVEINRTTPFKDRPFVDERPAFQIKASDISETSEYILEVTTAYPIVVKPELWSSATDYLRSLRINGSIEWFYYGIIAMLLFVNLFVYLNSNIRAYLYYAIFLGFHAVSISALEGIYIGTPFASITWIHQLMISSIPLTVIYALKFLEDFLDLDEFPKTFQFLKLLRRLFFLLLVQFFLLPFPSIWSVVIQVQSILVIITSAIYPIICGYRALSNRREHLLIFVAFIPHFIAVLYYSLQVIGLMDYDPNYYYKLLGSSLAEMLLISVALGFLVKSIQAAKLASDRAAIQNLKRAIKAEEANSAELEAKVKERTSELSAASAEKSRMLSMLSHDLRAPMYSIVQYTEMTLETVEDATNDEYKTFVIDINESTKSLKSLVDNLLTWTRTNWEGIQANPISIDLRKAIDDIIEIYAVQITSKGILISEIPEDPPKIIADPNMLDTVLRNIISNALTHSSSGEAISFDWETVNERLNLKIHNTGFPIKESIAEALSKGDPFEPRLEEISRGLGLRLCKATSDVNNWNFNIRATENGTVASLSFEINTSEGNSQHFD